MKMRMLMSAIILFIVVFPAAKFSMNVAVGAYSLRFVNDVGNGRCLPPAFSAIKDP